eukprot:jgi/Chlat1/6193/Chrsp427S05727
MELGAVRRAAAAATWRWSCRRTSVNCRPARLRVFSCMASAPSNPAELRGVTGSKDGVVSVEWLKPRLKDVKVLDASWYMPGDKRDTLEEFHKKRIPGAKFFDIEAISDPHTDLPHMLPSEASFSGAASALGLANSDTIVCYDTAGLFSAARAWWTFKVFGHGPVYVLDGGLPAWVSAGCDIDTQSDGEAQAQIDSAVKMARELASSTMQAPAVTGLSYKASLQESWVRSLDQTRGIVAAGNPQMVDARGAGRFIGTAPEPRAGVRGGHMPGSKNVPFSEVLQEGRLKSIDDCAAAFKKAGVDLERPIVTTCGTGVTAAVLALALNQLGHKDFSLYDGSWTEWGGRSDTPVETSYIGTVHW